MMKWFEQNSWEIAKKTLHKTGSSAVTNITLKLRLIEFFLNNSGRKPQTVFEARENDEIF